jgi:hypothetical protein
VRLYLLLDVVLFKAVVVIVKNMLGAIGRMADR